MAGLPQSPCPKVRQHLFGNVFDDVQELAGDERAEAEVYRDAHEGADKQTLPVELVERAHLAGKVIDLLVDVGNLFSAGPKLVDDALLRSLEEVNDAFAFARCERSLVGV